jgi:hypothetical protein
VAFWKGGRHEKKVGPLTIGLIAFIALRMVILIGAAPDRDPVIVILLGVGLIGLSEMSRKRLLKK